MGKIVSNTLISDLESRVGETEKEVILDVVAYKVVADKFLPPSLPHGWPATDGAHRVGDHHRQNSNTDTVYAPHSPC
jgi:hypothetical protein